MTESTVRGLKFFQQLGKILDELHSVCLFVCFSLIPHILYIIGEIEIPRWAYFCMKSYLSSSSQKNILQIQTCITPAEGQLVSTDVRVITMDIAKYA